VSVFVQRAFQFRPDDAALVIRQRDRGLDLQFGDEFAMQDSALSAMSISPNFAGGETD
jgi:hypothetical protein